MRMGFLFLCKIRMRGFISGERMILKGMRIRNYDIGAKIKKKKKVKGY